MLSTENPSDPSCSCHVPVLNPDGSSDLDENHELPHFSIRDYVFSARNKDIEANWPFPQHVLHLCLKHGVKEPLPPFEPPDLVRDQRLKKVVKPERLNTSVDSEKALPDTNPLDKEDASPFGSHNCPINGKSCQSSDLLGCNEASGEGVSTLTHHVEITCGSDPVARLTSSFPEANSISESSVKSEALEPPHPSKRSGSLCGQPDKKCRLVVKLGSACESSRTEEIVSNSSALSEPMASKVCPVCKIFSSTSNTTLNAHIDQCLAVESTCKQVLTDTNKYRAKMRRKRLMVDIYATAARCTLEDLDRRNGTNWALDLNPVVANGNVASESKRPRIGQLNVLEDGDDEHEVYVDSNGTKLRILSKFNDVVAQTVGDDFGPRVDSKCTNEGKILALGRRKRLGRKCSKHHLKVKPQSKKLRSLRLYKCEVTEAVNEEYHNVVKEKEKSLSQLLKAQNSTKTGGTGTLRQWVCSKRSSPSKRPGNKDGRVHAGGQSFTGNNLSTMGDSSRNRNHVLKFSRLSENCAISLSNKRFEVSANTTENVERKSPQPPEGDLNHTTETTSADGCVMKFVRSSGIYVSSPRCKRMEPNIGTTRAPPKLPRSNRLSLKTKKVSTIRKDFSLEKSTKSLKQSKNCVNRKNLPITRAQDGHVYEMSEQVGNIFSDVGNHDYAPVHVPDEDLGPKSVSPNQMESSQELNYLEDVMGSESEMSSSEESPGKNTSIESDQESDDLSISEQEDTVISKELQPELEYCSHDMVGGHMDVGSLHQYYNSGDQGSITANKVSDEYIEDTIMWFKRAQHLDGNALTMDETTQTQHFEEGRAGLLFQTKSQVDVASPRSCINQEINLVEQEVGKVQMAKPEASFFTETNQTPSQRMEADFTNPGDMGYEIHENSSVTSTEPYLTSDEHQPVDRDQSGSPVSANSGFTSLHPTRSDFKYRGLQSPSMGPSEVQDKVCVSLSDCIGKPTIRDSGALGRGSALASMNTGGAKREVIHRGEITALVSKEPVTLSDDEQCCCSRKESISRSDSFSYQDSQCLTQKRTVAAMILPLKTPDSNTRSEMCTSFSQSLGSNFDKVAIASLNLPCGPISTKASSNSGMVVQTCRDFGLSSPSSQTIPSPSTSSPVLRLMGKDLMVMNKEDDESLRQQKVPLAAPIDHPNSKYLSLLGYSTHNVSNQDSFSIHHRYPNESFINGFDPQYPAANYDVGISGGIRNCGNYKVPQQTPLQLPVNHQGMRRAGFLESVVQGPSGRADKQFPPKTVLNGNPNFPFSYNVEKSASSQAAPNLMREVIVIDDSPEVGPSSSSVDAKYNIGSTGNHLFPTEFPSVPMSSSFNTRPMKVISCYPTPNAFSRDLHLGPRSRFLVPCPSTNACPSKQGSTAAKDSGVPSPSSSIFPMQQVI